MASRLLWPSGALAHSLPTPAQHLPEPVDGSTVGADAQTMGRGRGNRHWTWGLVAGGGQLAALGLTAGLVLSLAGQPLPAASAADGHGRAAGPTGTESSSLKTTTTTTTSIPTTTTTPPAETRTPLAAQAKDAPRTTTTTTTTTTPTPTSAPAGIIGASGTSLTLNGAPYTFVGVNAYEIATDWGVNEGCGGDETQAQLDQLFSSLPPNSLVRFWAFQGTMATNIDTGQLDWAPLDRVFATAAAYHERLIVVATDQGGTCDGNHWQDPAWYEGGFMQPYPDIYNGVNVTPLSYWQYLIDLVTRYRSSPALGMWEPISEAEASTCPPQDEPDSCSGNQTCPDETAAAQALRYFFDTVGAEIHALDPEHLVEDGLLGGGQCGSSGSDYEYVSESPGIDVLSVHDYYGAASMGGDQWNGMAVRFSQAQAAGKPIIAGEVGLQAGAGPGCTTLPQRVSDFAAKEQAQFQGGSSGLLVWDWVPQPTSDCAYDTFPGDPLMALIATGPLST